MEEPIIKKLTVPVDKLPLSDGCKEWLFKTGICTLEDFVRVSWAIHREGHSFSLRLFNEVVGYLRTEDLLYLMEVE